MALIEALNLTQPSQVFSYTANSTAIQVSGSNRTWGGAGTSLKTLAGVATVTVTTPANKTWLTANVGTNQITITGHGFATGLACTLTTTGGLPTGLATSTTYYLYCADANTIAFATTQALAIAGTPDKTFTSTGNSGTGTVNITALAGGTIKLQKSLDGITWFDEGSSQNVTAAGSFYFEKIDPCAKYYSFLLTSTAGQLTVVPQFIGKANVG